MAEFDYKQRPFSRSVTDEQYAIAVGRIQPKKLTKCQRCGNTDPARRGIVLYLKPNPHWTACRSRWHDAR